MIGARSYESNESALESYYRERVRALEEALDVIRLRLARYEGTVEDGGKV